MNFDTSIERRGSGSIKWDRRPELDPYWVADMDFQSPPAVLEALRERVEYGVFGYAMAHDGLNEAVLDYLSTRHGYSADLEEIVHLGGLVPALSMAARAFGEPGDALLTCTPVYYPFLGVAKDAKMETLTVHHTTDSDGRFVFDWEALEAKVTPKTKVFLLCSPQNPLGRVFTEAEILEVAEFCQRHDLVLVSDEIHCDLVFDEQKTPFFSALSLPQNFHDNLIVLLSPSKTYNIAGLGYAYAVIPNDSTRRKFNSARGHTLAEINALSFYAAEAAYRHGEPWRQELVAYLRNNRDTLQTFVQDQLDGVSMVPMEATYLAWMDCTALGLDNPADHLEMTQQLYLTDGAFFGGPQHIRFNFGCPHARVIEGLEKVKAGFEQQS